MPNSTNDLRNEFKSQEYREAYADDYLNSFVAMQIQVLREQRGLSQEELAALIGTKQPGISRLENVDHASWQTSTLKKVAKALDVRLRISFETYGDLVFESLSFNRKFLQRPAFKDDIVFKSEKPKLSVRTARFGQAYSIVVSTDYSPLPVQEKIETPLQEVKEIPASQDDATKQVAA